MPLDMNKVYKTQILAKEAGLATNLVTGTGVMSRRPTVPPQQQQLPD
jgi:hypothetical protein